MKLSKRICAFFLSFLLLATACVPSAQAACRLGGVRKNLTYSVSDDLQSALDKVYKRYNFSVGWGVYDISGRAPKEVASHNANKKFQSNCTIKAAMLLYICKQMDEGKLSLDTKMYVNTGKLHYHDFGRGSGSYTVEYLLTRMIHVSNNVCYETFLRYATKETFNLFLAGLGSGTVVKSYNYMGDCTVSDRAAEWYALYKYCHSRAEHADFAWKLLTAAKFSPIRDGLKKTVAHKSGWYWESGMYGTAGDCAVVQTENGGCYLMVMFTKNNTKGNYSQALMRELAAVLDKVWEEYYDSLPLIRRKKAKF